MRSRAVIRVDGTPGGGKTTLVERLLEGIHAECLVARSVRDPKAKEYAETFPRRDAEIRRYRRAGAAQTARIVFPAGVDAWDDFYTGRFMSDYSEAVVLEGDSPVASVDLHVFVARAPAEGERLLVRARRPCASELREEKATLMGILEDPDRTERLLLEALGRPMVALLKCRPDGMESMRRALLGQVEAGFPVPAGRPDRRWELAPEFKGIERAGLVVVNIRSDADKQGAERLIEEVRSIRGKDAIRRDILGVRGTKIPITLLAADLSETADPGTMKAIRRIAKSIATASR